MIKLNDEEKETLSYSDVAYLILQKDNKKIKIQDLFKKVIKVLDLDDSIFENEIGNFFELLITDKRFIMLDNGYCDLKINHSANIILEDDEDDFEVVMSDEDYEDETEEEDSYDEEATDDDADDDLQDLVIMDSADEIEDSEL